MAVIAADASARLRGDERGYMMVALLVAMSVMAIWMSAALPAWRTLAQREKEAELVFRGEQYARAIGLFQRARGNATPPNLDVLINEKFLRKKYKDPITNDDFQLITPGTAVSVPGAPQGQGTQVPPGVNPSAGRGRGLDLPPSGGRQGQTSTLARGRQITVGGDSATGRGGAGGAGGVMGVVSKSTDRSFRLYNGRDTYNQWVFMAIQQSNRAGGPGGNPPGAGGPPGRGGSDGRGGFGQDGRGGFDGRGGLGGRDGRGGVQPPGARPTGPGARPGGPGIGPGGRPGGPGRF